jgi:mannose-6-phosphate isomerase-like protein (cupin superfamily)
MTMEIFELNESTVHPFEERGKNVLFQAETFKIRMIQVEAGGEIPPCAMQMNVIFCILEGSGVITVDGEPVQVRPHVLMVTPPATISMKSEDGMRVLGVQIDERVRAG